MFLKCCERLRSDRGSASVEFITVGMLLTVPLLYLVIALAQLQAGFMAAEAAARNGARTMALYGEAAQDAVAAGTILAFSDAGFSDVEPTLSIVCEDEGCRTPESTVTVTVEAQIPLPLIPTFGSKEGLGLPVSATAVMPVSSYADLE